MAFLVFGNQGTFSRGSLLLIAEDDHVFTKNERLIEWVASGEPPETWKRATTLVRITDKTKDELLFFTEQYNTGFLEDGEPIFANRYSFIEPPVESSLYSQLLSTGEASVTFTELMEYVIDEVT